MTTLLSKKDARVLAKKIRKENHINILDSIDLIKPYLKDKKVIGIYYPLKDEIDILPLLKLEGFRFCFPKTNGLNMEFYEDDIKDFTEGAFHVVEPKGIKKVSKDEIDLFIIPSLAVNKDNYRLGYGKGYYDRYLKDAKGFKLCIQASNLVLPFKEEENDIRMDGVILCTQ